MDLASKVEFLKFHQGYVRGVAFSPVVRFKVVNTKLYQSVEILLSFYRSACWTGTKLDVVNSSRYPLIEVDKRM